MAVGNEQPPRLGHLERQQPWKLIDQEALSNLPERRPRRLPSSRPGSVSLDRSSQLQLDEADLLTERPEASAENDLHGRRIGGASWRRPLPLSQVTHGPAKAGFVTVREAGVGRGGDVARPEVVRQARALSIQCDPWVTFRDTGPGEVPRFSVGAPCEEDELAAGPVGGVPHVVEDVAGGA